MVLSASMRSFLNVLVDIRMKRVTAIPACQECMEEESEGFQKSWTLLWREEVREMVYDRNLFTSGLRPINIAPICMNSREQFSHFRQV